MDAILIAIAFLVMQDILAVLFLAFSTGKTPSIWGLAIFPALFLLRPLLGWLLGNLSRLNFKAAPHCRNARIRDSIHQTQGCRLPPK